MSQYQNQASKYCNNNDECHRMEIILETNFKRDYI